jgi:hypothetical protein
MNRVHDSVNMFFEKRLTIPFLCVFCFLILAAFVLISRNGYGDNLNNYGMLRSWQVMVANGIYTPSRFQGNLPSELIIGTLASLFGPYGPNSFSLIMSIFALCLSFYFFYQLNQDWKTSALAVATIAANPSWVNASSTSMDYVHPIPIFLFGLFLLQKQWTVIAAVLFAIAGGDRISYVPMGLLALCWAWRREIDPGRRKLILQSLVVFAVIGGLIYVPVFISSHLRLTFLGSARPPQSQGLFGYAARWAYKLLYLYGVLGTMVVAAILATLFLARRLDSHIVNSDEGTFLATCVLVIVYHLILFFYIPVRVEYLLPLLIGVAGIFVVKNASAVLMVVVIIAELSYWFVSIDLLRIEHQNDNPCAAVIALSARFEPHLARGVLVPALTNNTNELLCMPQILLERPANIKERLPKPMVREGG